jgi:uncharacterized membrane protein YfcA
MAAAYVIAVIATPAGISGAVLLLPFQVSVLGTPSPAVTPTNLLYNVVATPGALYRYRRQHQAGGRLAVLLTAGTLPGVIAGSVIRVVLLPSPRVFDLVVAAVLLPLGAWLAATRPPREAGLGRPAHPIPAPAPALITLACAVGCIGGIYGIGGGSILAPVLIGSGLAAAEVAPAALASTFVTSVAGVVTFTVLSLSHHGPVAPDWATGLALGLGGLAGAYTGARLQVRKPDVLIRRVVGVLVIAIAVRYFWSGLRWPLPPFPAPSRAPRARADSHTAPAPTTTEPAGRSPSAGRPPDRARAETRPGHAEEGCCLSPASVQVAWRVGHGKADIQHGCRVCSAGAVFRFCCIVEGYDRDGLRAGAGPVRARAVGPDAGAGPAGPAGGSGVPG